MQDPAAARGPKAGDADETVAPGQYYAALIDLSGKKDDARTYRRQVMGTLQEVASRMRAIGKASAGSTGFHGSVHYIAVLLYRANAGHRIKARDIQRGLGYTAGGVTRRLDAMVRDGLVVREADPGDGRAWLARLTPAGVALAERLLGEADTRSHRLEREFTLEEWRTMLDLLERFKTALDSDGNSGPPG